MIFQRDQLNNVICNLRIPNGNCEEIGTAIFIVKNNEPYIITASHVINSINSKAYVIISDKDGVPTKILLNELLGGSSFEKHPIADLAKAKIIINPTNSNYLNGRCFPYEQIDLSETMISKDVELTTIGFPLGLGALGSRFSPLTFRSFVAAPVLTLPRFDDGRNSDFIILELPSIGGYSGGPTFDLGYVISGGLTTTKEYTKLHGIVHGTINDQTGGKLAAITPCKYLKDWI